jgi:cytoskeletal protein RodZ
VDLVKKDPQDQEMVNLIASETEYRGPFLRKVREYYGITLDELCEFTKISKSYLNCLEAEEFDSLPAPAYVRGFVLQVAKAIKLPHEKAAAGYMKHYYSVVGGN